MTRRMVAGNIPGFGVDIRMSRRGVDAMTADRDNPLEISFAASRVGMARLADSGQLEGADAQASIGPYSSVPVPLIGTFRGGVMMTDDYVRYEDGQIRVDGTPFAARVTSGTITLQQILFASATPGGTKLLYVCFAP